MVTNDDPRTPANRSPGHRAGVRFRVEVGHDDGRRGRRSRRARVLEDVGFRLTTTTRLQKLPTLPACPPPPSPPPPPLLH